MSYSQRNIEQLFKLIGSIPNQEYRCSTYFECIKTKDSIWPNQLINLNAPKENINEVLNQIEDISETGEIPNLLMLKPTIEDDFLLNQIRKRGYTSSVWSAMTHSMNLSHLERQEPALGLQIRHIKSKDDLKDWLTIVETELMKGHRLNEEIFTTLLNNKDCYYFLGFEKKKAVATSLLFVNEGSAGIYLISTAESHRRRGFGKEMTRVCLVKAKELGCDQVDLQATKLGAGVYKSLGFMEEGAINVFRIKRTNTRTEHEK